MLTRTVSVTESLGIAELECACPVCRVVNLIFVDSDVLDEDTNKLQFSPSSIKCNHLKRIYVDRDRRDEEFVFAEFKE